MRKAIRATAKAPIIINFPRIYPSTAQTTRAKTASPKPTIAIADSERRWRESAILFDSSDGFSILFRSTTNTSASRIVAYCEIIARIPVAAATPIV